MPGGPLLQRDLFFVCPLKDLSAIVFPEGWSASSFNNFADVCSDVGCFCTQSLKPTCREPRSRRKALYQKFIEDCKACHCHDTQITAASEDQENVMPRPPNGGGLLGLFGAGSGNIMVSTLSQDPAKCLPKGNPGVCLDDAGCCSESSCEKHSSRFSGLLFGVLHMLDVGSCG
ncbi:MAG: hypothetical protein M1836_004637 [Candelina mexicana]|nr:MAG: hypothetical protein M1836_004637 [Candelina mexicana]